MMMHKYFGKFRPVSWNYAWWKGWLRHQTKSRMYVTCPSSTGMWTIWCRGYARPQTFLWSTTLNFKVEGSRLSYGWRFESIAIVYCWRSVWNTTPSEIERNLLHFNLSRYMLTHPVSSWFKYSIMLMCFTNMLRSFLNKTSLLNCTCRSVLS